MTGNQTVNVLALTMCRSETVVLKHHVSANATSNHTLTPIYYHIVLDPFTTISLAILLLAVSSCGRHIVAHVMEMCISFPTMLVLGGDVKVFFCSSIRTLHICGMKLFFFSSSASCLFPSGFVVTQSRRPRSIRDSIIYKGEEYREDRLIENMSLRSPSPPRPSSIRAVRLR